MMPGSGQVGKEMMRELYQKVLNRKGMPNDWETNVVVPSYKGKDGVLNCGTQRCETIRS